MLFKVSNQFAGRMALGLLAALSLAQVALADDDGGSRGSRVPLLPSYKQECAACHTAYPPGMLPAASWQRVMGNLSKHYGADASLDPATVKELSTWLGAHAGTYKRVRQESLAPPQDRITRSAWFIRKHDEVSAASWKLPAVKSAANCAACHTQADKGDFNEHNVRIPR
jgi:mono/diheme cytochrome c family protein